MIIDLFEEIVLTPSEEFVVDALRIIEPTIERIATSGTERRRLNTNRVGIRGGLLVRCQGIKDRIPIGSMGDGIWRMLGLALALARTKGGVLLIDEIDTGLHYSVMENMWKLVSKTANCSPFSFVFSPLIWGSCPFPASGLFLLNSVD